MKGPCLGAFNKNDDDERKSRIHFRRIIYIHRTKENAYRINVIDLCHFRKFLLQVKRPIRGAFKKKDDCEREVRIHLCNSEFIII